MGWFTDMLLGSEGEIDWDELGKMVELQSRINRTDRSGVYGGWEWERDPDGNPTNRQVQTINPAFQGAVDRLGGRAVQGNTNYSSPSQFSSMLDGKMATQMRAQGLQPGEGGVAPWQPSAGRQGLTQESAYLPPAPPAEGEMPPTFEVQDPLPPVDYLPGDSPEEIAIAEDPSYGLPPDYYNDKGNIRRKYRPDNKNYVGDEFLARFDDPNYVFRADDPNNPEDWYNKKGQLRDRYKIGLGGSNTGQRQDPTAGG